MLSLNSGKPYGPWERGQNQRTARVSVGSGFSLIDSLVAIAIVGIAALVVARQTTSSVSSAAYAAQLLQLEALRREIRERFDCQATLGIDNATQLPLACSNTVNFLPRGSDGTVIGDPSIGGGAVRMGPWTVWASCEPSTHSLTFKASKPNVKVPLSGEGGGKFWQEMPYATDLFRGATRYCNQFFMDQTCAPGTTYQGTDNKGPICCRVAADRQVNATAAAWCSPYEYLSYGWGRCASGYSMTGMKLNYRGDGIPINWQVDCWDTVDGVPDAQQNHGTAFAYAMCCPRY